MCWVHFFPLCGGVYLRNRKSQFSAVSNSEKSLLPDLSMRGAELKKIPAPSQSCRTQSKLSFDKSDFPMVFLVISTWKMHQSPDFLVQCFEDGHCCFPPEKFCVWLAGLWCRRFLAAPRTVIPCQPPFSNSAVPSIKHSIHKTTFPMLPCFNLVPLDSKFRGAVLIYTGRNSALEILDMLSSSVGEEHGRFAWN